jgi:hypothetical protein
MEDQAILGLTMKRATSHPKFVLCVRPSDSEDLEVRKVYAALPDQKAAKEGYLRIVDESGEDYLYPAEFFVPVKLPAATMREFAPDTLSAAREPASVR